MAGTVAQLAQGGGRDFTITRESSTDHFMVSGQDTAISGVTMGVYLFRNANVSSSGE